jgi:hypothetical protein
LIDRLNAAWKVVPPPRLDVTLISATQARITANGNWLIDVLPGDAREGDVLREARSWTSSLERLFRDRPEVRH